MFPEALVRRFLEAFKVAGNSFFLGLIDVVHQKVHEGKTYTINALKDTASGENLDLYFTTGDASMHIVIEARSEGKAYFQSFVNSDVTGGTPVIPFNRKAGGDPSTVTVVQDPTINNVGDQRGNVLIPASSVFFSSSGASYGDRIESVIGPNTSFMLRISNQEGAGTDDLNFVIDYYEVE